jgi:hypothetical protein
MTTLKTLAFREIIRMRGINPFIAVSAARASALKSGWRKPLPVLLRINGKPAEPCHTNMMPGGDGSYYLYLNGVVRKAAEASVGDWVEVEIEFDTKYRSGPQHPMPLWFRRALKEHPQAHKNWDALTPSRKKEILRYLAGLRSIEARSRNMTKAIEVLSGRNGRFMARLWINGS